MTGLIVRIEGIEKAASVTFYTERDRCVRYEKKNLIRVLEEKGVSYYAMVDTRFIGRGNIMARVVFLDEEADGTRKVVAEGYTGFSVPCVCEGMGKTIKCGDYEVTFAKVDDIPVNYGTKVYVGALGEWVTGYKYITEEMVKNNLVEHSIGSAVRMDVRSGDRMVVAVPKDRKIGVFKDNGFGEKTAFDEKIMGANGLEMKIDGVDYKIYGEFFIVDGELNFYINMKNIIVDGPLVFSKANCPTREGEMVDSVNEIYDIPTPREGMLVYVRNEKKTYIVTALKEKTINGVVVPQAAVESFELFAQGAQAENVETIEWNENCNIDLLLEAGEYRITGTRNATDDGLPILNTGHIEAVLMVMVAKEQEVAMQKLTLLNVNGGDANVYIRTLQNGAWDKWGKMQTNIEVNAVETLDNLTDNGIYSGVLGTETFVLVVINNYAVATQAGSGAYISQLKYAVDLQGAVTVKTRRRDAFGIWNEWTELGGGGTSVAGTFPQLFSSTGSINLDNYKNGEIIADNGSNCWYPSPYIVRQDANGNKTATSLGFDFIERFNAADIKEGELNGNILKQFNKRGEYRGLFINKKNKNTYFTLRVENGDSKYGNPGHQILQYVDEKGNYVVKSRIRTGTEIFDNNTLDPTWGDFQDLPTATFNDGIIMKVGSIKNDGTIDESVKNRAYSNVLLPNNQSIHLNKGYKFTKICEIEAELVEVYNIRGTSFNTSGNYRCFMVEIAKEDETDISDQILNSIIKSFKRTDALNWSTYNWYLDYLIANGTYHLSGKRRNLDDIPTDITGEYDAILTVIGNNNAIKQKIDIIFQNGNINKVYERKTTGRDEDGLLIWSKWRAVIDTIELDTTSTTGSLTSYTFNGKEVYEQIMPINYDTDLYKSNEVLNPDSRDIMILSAAICCKNRIFQCNAWLDESGYVCADYIKSMTNTSAPTIPYFLRITYSYID